MTGVAVAPDNVSADPVLDAAQAAIDAHTAASVTEPAKPADAVVEPPKTPEPPKEPEKPAAQRSEDGKFAVDYTKVTLPKDASIDAEALGRTVAIARAQGLPREQAQAVVDLVNSEVAQSKAALVAAYQPGGAEWARNVDLFVNAEKESWRSDLEADVTLGKTPEERKAAIDLGGGVIKRFKTVNPQMGEAFDKFLIDSGIGNRREVAHFLAWLGKAAGERPMSLGSDTSVAGDPLVNQYIANGMNP